MAWEWYNINKSFGEQRVLQGVSLLLQEGEMVCLMGASGSGKTTLLSVLAGLIEADAERGEQLQRTMQKKQLHTPRISMVFQEDRLIESKDAFINLALVQKHPWDRERMRQEFAGVGLSEYEHKPAADFSGGMKRRLAIVRAVCAEYDLLLMDEPFKGLDETTKGQVISYVKERTKGRTVLFVTHDLQEATLAGARILRLEELSGKRL